MSALEETVMVGIEEEDEGEKVEVIGFPLSKQVGVVLERENKLFLGREEGNSKLLGGEVRWFFGRTISFGVGRTKVRGLNLNMAGTFS